MTDKKFENQEKKLCFTVYFKHETDGTWWKVAQVMTLQHAFMLAQGAGYGDRVCGYDDNKVYVTQYSEVDKQEHPL